jgi:preprotein translocase subunit SecE
LTAFLIGEIFCGINFLTFRHASLISEYIHSYGMVLAFGFITYAFLEILDGRILHINNGRCTVGELCGICKRTSPLQCAARRSTLLVLVLTTLISFLPFLVSASPKSYVTDLFGYPYSYARFALYQWFETRALPLFALASFLVAFIPLFTSKSDPIPQMTKIFFSASIGALGFSLFRITLGSIFADDLVWFEFWEEATELMLISSIGFILWQFRTTLLEETPILDQVFGQAK